VPPYAGECRFVRVTSVLIFAGDPSLCCFCVGAKAPTARDICPAADSRQRPSQGARRTGHAACRQGHAGPGRMAVPCRNAAHRWTRRRLATRTLSKHHRAHPARPSITTAAPAWRPSADRTTHSNEKRLLSISNRADRVWPLTIAPCGTARCTHISRFCHAAANQARYPPSSCSLATGARRTVWATSHRRTIDVTSHQHCVLAERLDMLVPEGRGSEAGGAVRVGAVEWPA
jgi:hypothetical protein